MSQIFSKFVVRGLITAQKLVKPFFSTTRQLATSFECHGKVTSINTKVQLKSNLEICQKFRSELDDIMMKVKIAVDKTVNIDFTPSFIEEMIVEYGDKKFKIKDVADVNITQKGYTLFIKSPLDNIHNKVIHSLLNSEIQLFPSLIEKDEIFVCYPQKNTEMREKLLKSATKICNSFKLNMKDVKQKFVKKVHAEYKDPVQHKALMVILNSYMDENYIKIEDILELKKNQLGLK